MAIAYHKWRSGDGPWQAAVCLVRSNNPAVIERICPKGHVEPLTDETDLECAIRELREEAGYLGQVSWAMYLGTDDMRVHSVKHGEQDIECHIYLLEVDYPDPDINVGPPEDGRAPLWVPFEAAIEMVPFDNLKDRLQQAQWAIAPRLI